MVKLYTLNHDRATNNDFLTLLPYFVFANGSKSVIIIYIKYFARKESVFWSRGCFPAKIFSRMSSTNTLTVNPFPNKPWCLQHKSFESTVGKGEIARNEQFLLFAQIFFFFFHPFVELSAIFIKLKIVVCKLFQLGRV